MGIQSISMWLVRNRLFVISLVCLGVAFMALSGPAGAVTPQIDAGGHHTAALKSDGTLWAWGFNIYGQLGDGTTDNKTIPTQVGIDANWIAVSAGEYHTAAIKSDGTLWAWGFNKYGQLGNGTTDNKATPTQVGADNDWAAVSAGGYHTLALKTDGSLWAWGWNFFYQLGIETIEDENPFPMQVGSSFDWTMISAGIYYNMAIKSDGTLWTWGYNFYGEMGIDADRSRFPMQVRTDTNWATVCAGYSHTAAVKLDGTLWTWGRGEWGQLGTGKRETEIKSAPLHIGTDTNWANVSVGAIHTAAIKTTGAISTCGMNYFQGQLGLGNWTPFRTSFTQVGTDNDWVVVVTGKSHTVAFKSNGTFWSWGGNTYGQVGDGTTINKFIPVQLVDFNLGPANQPPIADAGADQAVVEGDTVFLDGTASSDPDGDPLAYWWTITSTPVGSAAFLSDPASPTPTFTADLPGDYFVELVVNDGYVDSDPDSVFITALTYQEAAIEIGEELIEIINSLPPDAFANPNRVIPLTDKLNEVIQMIEDGLYLDARDKLLHDLLPKTDGCATQGAPDRNDWIDNCEDQAVVYPLVLNMIDLLNNLL